MEMTGLRMGDTSETETTLISSELDQLMKAIEPTEIIPSTPSAYLPNSQTWTVSKDLHPQLVVRPQSVESLVQIITTLSRTKLQCAVRSQGFGSASARHVLVSLSAFDQVEFNRQEEYVIVGTGQPWFNYYERMQEVASDWTVVAARILGVGIGGSTLCGGFSWISSQYGCISDPSNLLDAYVVEADGSHFWAAEKDPDLLWAMRGSAGGFAIATHFKFRARHYPQNGRLWGGSILVPMSRLDQVAKGIIGMVERDAKNEVQLAVRGKTGIFLQVMRKELFQHLEAKEDILLVQVFDERGTEAGRAALKWALDLDGANDQTTGNMTMFDVAKLQAKASELKGKATTFWSFVALTQATQTPLTEDTIKKAVAWWKSTAEEPGSIKQNGVLRFELFTSVDSFTGRYASAWPRPPAYEHSLLFGTGCAPDASLEEIGRARQVILDAHSQVFGRNVEDLAVVPNALEDYHDIKRVFGDKFDRLREVKTRVDPHDQLGGWIRPLVSQPSWSRDNDK